MKKRWVTMGVMAALLGSLGLAACDKQQQDSDAALSELAKQSAARASEKAKAAGAEVNRSLAEAKDATRDMARDAKQDAQQAGARISDRLADALITTTVNAEIARDAKLSALKIDVDTADGRVALRGSAPSSDARERATTLAMAVKGVVSVDNQLTVEPRKTGG